MKARRLPLDLFACSLMLVLCLIWGFQQVSIKLVDDDVSAIMQLAIRSGVAALVLGIITLYREGRGAFSDGTLLPGLGVGLLFALEFLFISEGLVRSTASHIGVFLYTAPIFAALGLHLILPEERLSSLQWLGVLVAFGGIALAFLGNPGNDAGATLLGDAMGVIAAIAWGATTVLIRGSSLSEAAPVKTLFYQLAGAVVLLLAVAFATGKTVAPERPGPAQPRFPGGGGGAVQLRRLVLAAAPLPRFAPVDAVVHDAAVRCRLRRAGVGRATDHPFMLGALLVLAGLLLVSGAELVRDRLARRRTADAGT